jgi:PAS domain S-box-containing protein
MIPEALLTLAQNMGLLLALTYVYSLLLPLRERLSRPVQTIAIGFSFGLFAVLVMLNPISLAEGVRFDGRSVIVALACIYGSIPAGIITTLIITTVRFAMGGAGAITSVFSLMTVILMCYWYRRRYSQQEQFATRQLVLLGLLIWVQTMAWIVLVTANGLQAVMSIGLPSLLFNPTTLLFVGKLLNHQDQRTLLENALRESEQRFREIANASDELFWIYDPRSTQPLYVSPAYTRIWKRPIETLYADFLSLLETIHPDDRSRAQAALNHPGSEAVTSEIRILRPDGEMRWVAVRIHPLLDGQKKVARLVGTAEDITERKNAESQKIELQIERARGKMLREFINAASHDLRTPITVMGTSLYLLGRTSQPQQKTYIDQIETQVYRMRRLVDDMMTISRLDADDSGFVLEAQALNDFAQECVQRHMQEATTKERVLTTQFATPSPWARIDPAQLSHAMERLIKNAIAYTEPGDQITVKTALEGDEAVICITDTGQGIDAEDLPHIFERFYRADKARGVTSGGAGLGLPIARRIIELHHGRIEVESTPDVGSTFRVILPAVAPLEAGGSAMLRGERRYF